MNELFWGLWLVSFLDQLDNVVATVLFFFVGFILIQLARRDYHNDNDLHNCVMAQDPHTIFVPDGVFAKCTPRTVHRCSPARRRGWRLYFRFAMMHKPNIINAVNPQQQVYVLTEGNGW